MSTLMLNGSLRTCGNTNKLFNIFKDNIKDKLYIEDSNVLSCLNCGKCIDNIKCSIKDNLSDYLLEELDYIFIFSSVYFFGLNGKAKSMLDRLYSYRNVENTTLVLVTTSGSDTNDLFSGVNLIIQQFQLIKEYCGYKDFRYINFVTDDKIIDFKEEDIKVFIEGLYNETKEEI